MSTTIFLQAMGMPAEFAALLGGIVSVVDMGLTTLNCSGSVVVAAMVSAGEDRREEKEKPRRKRLRERSKNEKGKSHRHNGRHGA